MKPGYKPQIGDELFAVKGNDSGKVTVTKVAKKYFYTTNLSSVKEERKFHLSNFESADNYFGWQYVLYQSEEEYLYKQYVSQMRWQLEGASLLRFLTDDEVIELHNKLIERKNELRTLANSTNNG